MTPRALIYLGAASLLLGGTFLYLKQIEREQEQAMPESTLSQPVKIPESFTQVRVKNGSLVGEAVRLQTTLGEPIGLEVLIDQDDEIHLHGIDLTFELKANQTNQLTLEAQQTGAFEIELHGLPVTLGVLEVYPK